MDQENLYVETPAKIDILSIEVDVKIAWAIIIASASALISAILCLFSHTPFMIEKSVCHKNVS